MELKSLFLGLIFGMGSFGIKSGAGLFYIIKSRERLYKKVFILFLFAVIYLAIFVMFYLVISHTGLVKYIGLFPSLFPYAMVIHVIVAGGLTFWGISLLKRERSTPTGTHAWLLMVIPCPVCLTVIFLALSFVMSFFPQQAHKAVFLVYLIFIILVFATSIFMGVWRINQSMDHEKKLGLMMIIIAAYFVLSIVIMPNFKEVDRIYRLALYRGTSTLDTKQWFLLGLIVAIGFLSGFFYKYKKIKGMVR